MGLVTIITVALSALLHGVTAAPFARRYADIARRVGECEELQPVPEMPLRGGMIESADDSGQSQTGPAKGHGPAE